MSFGTSFSISGHPWNLTSTSCRRSSTRGPKACHSTDRHANWSIVEAVRLMSMTSDGQCSALGLARWAQHGFRTVVMPATYAAALCATVPPPCLENLASPVPAFMIEIPGELLPVENPAGADFVARAFVFRHDHRLYPNGAWAYVAPTNRGLTLWRFGVDAAGLLPQALAESIANENASFPMEIAEMDRRTSTMLGRLIVNTCLAMTNSDVVKIRGNVFHVGQRIEADLRQAVSTYCRGGRSPATGTWVSSHWKTQPYGPGNSLRKWIFVEPYWRGMVDLNG